MKIVKCSNEIEFDDGTKFVYENSNNLIASLYRKVINVLEESKDKDKTIIELSLRLGKKEEEVEKLKDYEKKYEQIKLLNYNILEICDNYAGIKYFIQKKYDKLLSAYEKLVNDSENYKFAQEYIGETFTGKELVDFTIWKTQKKTQLQKD